jgi:hypothetical protein
VSRFFAKKVNCETEILEEVKLKTLTQDSRFPKSEVDEQTSKLHENYESFGGLYRSVCLKSLRVDGRSLFAGFLAMHLPEVAERIDYDDFGILNLEVGALKLATRDAIARRDWHAVGKHFAFVAGLLEHAGAELLDALHVSYLGMLFHGEASINYQKARSLMPKALSNALEHIERHYDNLAP